MYRDECKFRSKKTSAGLLSLKKKIITNVLQFFIDFIDIFS